MIITKKKSFEDILKMLGGYTNIFLVGCGECSTTAHTGGEKEILEMKQYLESNGKKVVGSAVPKAPCISAQIKGEFAKNMAGLKTAEAVLVMSCGLGVQSVKQNNRLGQDVFPALDTIAGVIMDGAGNFSEVCSNCSECVLDKTGGICPITRCPKGLLNGPCGGVNKGKCEVDKTRDCAWVLIYRELEKKNRLKEFKEISAAKDYSKIVKPHNVAASK